MHLPMNNAKPFWPICKPMHVKKLLAGGLLLALGNLSQADPFTDLGVDTPKARLPAPAFNLSTLEGDKKQLSDYRGKVVLLNFWATWCLPCRDEMPGMQTLYKKYKDRGLMIAAVSADQNNFDNVKSFVNQLSLDFPVLMDPKGDVRNRYEVIGLPMSYLIGRDGKISGRVLGEKEWDSAEAFALIEHLLNEAPIRSGQKP